MSASQWKGVLLAIIMAAVPAEIRHEPAGDCQLEECTIGVASGRATSDGRPLVWKTRDADQVHNEVMWVTAYTYNFVAVVSAGSTTPWMGVNTKGFAILNSLSSDLPGGSSGPANGTLMRDALGTCATVAEFQALLDRTNVTGRSTQANFAVIDSTGAGAIFETGGSQYWKYDAHDPSAAPNGYVLRTNFALHGGGSSGIERYRRTVRLIADFYAGDSLNYRSILRTQMRDFSDENSTPVPVPFPGRWRSDRPYGYIYCYVSICRSTSVSAAVIQGVGKGEPARLSTMWAILGQPAAGIAVPYWPVGNTPVQANSDPTAPLCDAALAIKALLFDYPANTHYLDSYKLLDGRGGGFWTKLFPAEDMIMKGADSLLALWRLSPPLRETMLEAEARFAAAALSVLQQAYRDYVTGVIATAAEQGASSYALTEPYPNPFNATMVCRVTVSDPTEAEVVLYNARGQLVATLLKGTLAPGEHLVRWNGTDDTGVAMASGTYFIAVRTPRWQERRRCVLVR